MYSKAEIFESHQQDLALFGKALAHPARIAIIELLSQRQSCYSGDIAQEIPLNRSTVSQHLQALKKIGLLTGNTEGLNVSYCLNAEKVKALKEALHYLQELLQNASCQHPLSPTCNP